jgi:hypothetical protein
VHTINTRKDNIGKSYAPWYIGRLNLSWDKNWGKAVRLEIDKGIEKRINFKIRLAIIRDREKRSISPHELVRFKNGGITIGSTVWLN